MVLTNKIYVYVYVYVQFKVYYIVYYRWFCVISKGNKTLSALGIKNTLSLLVTLNGKFIYVIRFVHSIFIRI